MLYFMLDRTQAVSGALSFLYVSAGVRVLFTAHLFPCLIPYSPVFVFGSQQLGAGLWSRGSGPAAGRAGAAAV